jgi:hypothetical protein
MTNKRPKITRVIFKTSKKSYRKKIKKKPMKFNLQLNKYWRIKLKKHEFKKEGKTKQTQINFLKLCQSLKLTTCEILDLN